MLDNLDNGGVPVPTLTVVKHPVAADPEVIRIAVGESGGYA